MYIPDPIERMEARIDDLAFEWDVTQKGVPAGSFRCPYCKNIFDYEPIQATSSPDSPAMCYDCLPEDTKRAYDEFCDDLKKKAGD